jgi:hypothetical protein
MSIEQVESAIQALPLEQRRRLARWFDDHRHEFLKPEASDENMESSQQREVLTRLAETEAHPASLEPFGEEDLDGMIRDFVHARAKKPSTG